MSIWLSPIKTIGIGMFGRGGAAGAGAGCGGGVSGIMDGTKCGLRMRTELKAPGERDRAWRASEGAVAKAAAAARLERISSATPAGMLNALK